MKDYSASTYGDRIAGVYDERYSDFQDLGPVVRTLAGLAGGGRPRWSWASAQAALRYRWPRGGSKSMSSTPQRR